MTQNLNTTATRAKSTRNVSKRRTTLFTIVGAVIGGLVGVVSAEPLSRPRHALVGPDFTGQLVAELIGYLFVPVFLGAVIGWFGARRSKAT